LRAFIFAFSKQQNQTVNCQRHKPMNKMKYFVFAAIIALIAACGGNGEHSHPEHGNHDHDANGHVHVHQDIDRLDEAERREGDAPHALAGSPAERFNAILDAYLLLSDALVESSATNAADLAGQLNEQVGNFDAEMVDQAVRSDASGWIETVRQRSREIADESDVEAQRRSYHELSETLITMVEVLGHQKSALYHQRCPMVNGGNGDWLSTQEGILNPYHGDRMLRCGMTVRIL
jgi:hypothetical protein